MIYPSKKITVGSRESPLAKAQVKVFLNVLSNKFGVSSLKFIKSKFLKTSGDIFLNKNISEIGNKGLFTKEIDEAQLRSEIDIAVHSLKDLPTVLPKGLFIGGVLKRERPNDVIFSLKKYDIKKSSKKIILGTSSIRRKIQLMHLNKNLDVLEIRGNVGTRIKKVIDGIFDGVILAEAGLRRLNITENYKSIDIRNIIPAVGQGVIALVIKKNKYTETLIDQINHKSTFIESDCERQFLRALDGSCKTPIGALAKIVKRNNNKKQIFFVIWPLHLMEKKIIKSKTFFDLNNYKKQSFKLGSKIKELI